MTKTVLVPSSLVRETRDKREATRKLGYVARAATVFRIDRLVVYPDRDGQTRWGDGFVRTVLAYAATPPYLRKELWGQCDELEYVGVLPPLLAVTQTGSGSDDPGSLRQGIVTEVGSDGRVRVNCGLQHPISLPVPSSLTVDQGERVTIRIASEEPLRARIITDESPPGVRVERATMDVALNRTDSGVRIAASRYGEELSIESLTTLSQQLTGATPSEEPSFTVAFGAPERGLPKILDIDPDGVELRDTPSADDSQPDRSRFDLWLNTVPRQGSETIRTEEALFATLACLNLE
ncbi:RNA methyltransferase [Halocatena halophila]|uniref:RNA methyltransferase n=1 Tax=Halocatena halophila TaxID=2814576 RepID=UPI002ED14E67